MKIKNRLWLCSVIVMGLVLVLTNSCKKNEEPSVIKDRDGNVYTSVTIGTQVWLVENLKTTKYNDGTSIPNITDNATWGNLNSPGYCWYNNDAATYKANYGALYNWYAVNTGKLCPNGWRVPTDAEWTILDNYLMANGYNYDGSTSGNKIAKSLASSTSWQPSNVTGAPGCTDYPTYRNKSGFTAISCGFRDNDGTFKRIGYSGDTWSSRSFDNEQAYEWDLDNDFSGVFLEPYFKKAAFLVRCLQD
jgi:uncharacterized protein (TIGR02145 family)